MQDVRIDNFKLGTGGLSLATFNCRIGGIEFRRCSVIRDRLGNLTAVPPRVDGNRSGEYGVWFADTDLRDRFRSRALAIYLAMIAANNETDDAGVRRFLSAEQETCEIAGI